MKTAALTLRVSCQNPRTIPKAVSSVREEQIVSSLSE